MNTEITDIKNTKARGAVCYDAECALCLRWAERFRRLLERNGFRLLPLQSPEARAALRVADAGLLAEMRVVTRDGTVFGGADAIVYLARIVPAGRAWSALASVPGVKPLLRCLYRALARNRSCRAGACAAGGAGDARKTFLAAIPLLVFTAAALSLRASLPPWAFMWTLAFALFAGCKWLTFRAAIARGFKPGFARAAGYLFAWIGMDAAAFFSGRVPAKPRRREWLRALANLSFGATLVWIGARMIPATLPLLAGWIGLFGLVFVLHFGWFRLLSLAWQTAGVDAEPLMRAPALSSSLGEFWGRRWNTAFHQLADEFVFRPARRIGRRSATMLVFLASGLVHELVISLPARGGYGWPTIYFLLQGAGVLAERRARNFAVRREVGNRRPGRAFMAIMTAGPVFCLFHPPFVRNVIVPFLKIIHAL